MKNVLMGFLLYMIPSIAADKVQHHTVLTEHAYLLEIIKNNEVKYMNWGGTYYYYITINETNYWFNKKSYEIQGWNGQTYTRLNAETCDLKIALKLFNACKKKLNICKKDKR